jgi:hypothetical protein
LRKLLAMLGNLRSLSIMFVAPPILLIVWAHLAPPLGLAALCAAVLVGLIGLATAPWSNDWKALGLLGYIIYAALALPFLGLIAECTTGNCL